MFIKLADVKFLNEALATIADKIPEDLVITLQDGKPSYDIQFLRELGTQMQASSAGLSEADRGVALSEFAAFNQVVQMNIEIFNAKHYAHDVHPIAVELQEGKITADAFVSTVKNIMSATNGRLSQHPDHQTFRDVLLASVEAIKEEAPKIQLA